MAQTPRAEAEAWEGSGGSTTVPLLSCFANTAVPKNPSQSRLGAPPGFSAGVLARSGSPCGTGRVYLDAADDGVVHPAHMGQGRAFHHDLHCLDGARGAEIIHGHLKQR